MPHRARTPGEPTPQVGLLLIRLGRVSLQGNRENDGPSGALTAATYDEVHEKYREFASRNVAHTNTETVLDRPGYPDAATGAVLVAPYGTADGTMTPRHGGRRHVAQPSTFDILG